MLNLFLQNSLLRKTITAVLIWLMFFSAAGWILFYPKPVKAITCLDKLGGFSQVIQTVVDIPATLTDAGFQASQTGTGYSMLGIEMSKQMYETIKEAIRIAGLIALHTVLNMLTNEIIKWIQGGGDPKFVTDWAGFLKDAANKAGGTFVNKYLGAGWLCKPFDLQIKIALLKVPKFEERVKCSITDIVGNLENFYNDFSKGGWKGWLKLTEPKNNFWGAYLMTEEEKLRTEAVAKEGAEKEASAGRGFLSVKACTQGHAEYGKNVVATCTNKDTCNDLKEKVKQEAFGEGASFKCDKEVAVTPGSVLSDITSRAADRELETLSRSIGDLADSMGLVGPYVIAIANALINRIMQEGLTYVTSIGPTAENPNAPMPAGTPIPPVDRTPAQAGEEKIKAELLIPQQQLLKENLETQLLPQQQSNLTVMQGISNDQTNILMALKAILARGCTLPSWASPQIISATTSGGTTTQIIQITASGIGNIIVKKITVVEGETTTSTFTIQEITPQINSQLTALQTKIEETNQWIADASTAINSANGYVAAIDAYLELYKTTLQPPTEEEQAALDQKKQAMEAAKNLTVANAQKAAKSTAADLMQLTTDTQRNNQIVVQEAVNLLQARGISQEYPQSGSLYEQQQTIQPKLTEAQNYLAGCSASAGF